MRRSVPFTMCVCNFLVNILLVKNLMRRDEQFHSVYYVCLWLLGRCLLGKEVDETRCAQFRFVHNVYLRNRIVCKRKCFVDTDHLLARILRPDALFLNTHWFATCYFRKRDHTLFIMRPCDWVELKRTFVSILHGAVCHWYLNHYFCSERCAILESWGWVSLLMMPHTTLMMPHTTTHMLISQALCIIHWYRRRVEHGCDLWWCLIVTSQCFVCRKITRNTWEFGVFVLFDNDS